MSLRWRLTLVIGGVVAVMLFGASFLAYISAESELNNQVDEFLLTRSRETELTLEIGFDTSGEVVDSLPPGTAFGFQQGTLRTLTRADASIQLLDPNRTYLRLVSGTQLPVTDNDRDLAEARGVEEERNFTNRRGETGEEYRVLVSSSPFGALMVGLSLIHI